MEQLDLDALLQTSYKICAAIMDANVGEVRREGKQLKNMFRSDLAIFGAFLSEADGIASESEIDFIKTKLELSGEAPAIEKIKRGQKVSASLADEIPQSLKYPILADAKEKLDPDPFKRQSAMYFYDTFKVFGQTLLSLSVNDVTGTQAQRQRLVAALALRMLCGSSSPFFTRLYADGTLNNDFDYEVDASAGTITVIIGGESRMPEKVLAELNAEIARVAAEGFNEAYFTRSKRASLGARLRALEDFDNVCVSLAMDCFDGYCSFDSYALLEEITAEDCRRFVAESLAPERLALSEITPKEAKA